MRLKYVCFILFFFLTLISCQFPTTQTIQDKEYLKQYQNNAEALEVDYFTPTGDIEVGQNKIVIHFSQPMVSLKTIGQEEDCDLVSVSPMPKGYFKWVNSRTLVFNVKGTFNFATQYTVTVHAGHESLLGFALLKDFSFSFSTPIPAIKKITPQNETDGISQKPEFHVTFNQAVADRLLSKKIKLISADSQKEYPLQFKCFLNKKEIALSPEKGCDEITILAKEQIAKNTKLKLVFKKNLKALEGPLSFAEGKEYSYKVHGDFKVTDIWCKKPCYPNGEFQIWAKTPIQTKDFHQFVTFTPDVERVEKAYKYWDKSQNALITYFNFKPNTDYTVTFLPGLKDIYGQSLKQKKVLTFKTAHKRASIKTPFVNEQVLNYDQNMNLGFQSINTKKTFVQFKVYNSAQNIIKLFNHSYDTIRNWVDNGYEWDKEKVFNGLIDDKWQNHFIKPEEVLGNRKSGLFLTVLTSPEVTYYDYGLKKYKPSFKWLFRQVTDLGIDVKLSKINGLVWVTSLKTAKAKANTKVLVYDNLGQLLYKTKTNQNGLATVPGYKELKQISNSLKSDVNKGIHATPFYFFASHEKDQAFLATSWDGDLNYGYYYYDDYSTSASTDDKNKDTVLVGGHLLTDRGLYKPGEEVFIKGYLREMTLQGLRAFTQPIEVVLTPPNSEKKIILKAVPNERGNFWVSHIINKDAALGYYSVSLKTKVSWAQIKAHTEFSVQKFRTPEFKLMLSVPQGDVYKSDSLNLNVLAEYLFGAPMRKARYELGVVPRLSYFDPPNNSNYQFGRLYEHREKDEENLYKIYEETKGELNEEGKLVFKTKIKSNYHDPIRYDYGVTVYDMSQQSISHRTHKLVHPARFYIGAKLNKLFYEKGDEVKVKFGLLNPQGETVLNKKVKAKLIQVKWVSVKRETLHAQYQTKSKRVEKEVAVCDSNAQNKANECVFTPNEAGYYFVKLEAKDSQNQLAITEVPLYIIGNDYGYWSDHDDFKLELVAEDKVYEKGDVAKILVKSPYQQAKALVAIERESVVSYQVRDISSATTLEIPIKESYAPNIYVSVVLIKGYDEIDASFKDDALKATPLIKAGKIELEVSPYQKDLKLAIKSNKNIYQPGDDVVLDFKVDQVNQNKKAEITVMVVDEGVLLAGGYNLKNPLDTLYAYGYHDVGLMDLRSRFVQKQGTKEKLEDPASGGGRSSQARQKFIPLAYFNPEIVTDEKGVASVSFKLPEQLTTFKVMAIANANTDQFGLGYAEFKTQKSLMIRPAFPRFARFNDKVTSLVVLHNQSDEDVVVNMSLESLGVKILEGKNQKVTVPKKGLASYPVSFVVDKDYFKAKTEPKLKSEYKKSAKITLNAKAKGYSDQVIIRFPVYQEYQVETIATSGASIATVTEQFEKNQTVKNNMGGLELSLAANLILKMQGKIKALKAYPFECLEQQMSRIYPFVLFPFKDFMFQKQQQDPTYRFKKVEEFIKKLKRLQNYRGGFSFWPQSTESPVLTLMVAEFLVHAKQAGHDVDVVLNKIKKRVLDTYLKETSYDLRLFGQQYKDKLKIHALYVLYLMGDAQPSYYELFSRSIFGLDFMSQLRFMIMLSAHDPFSNVLTALKNKLNNKIRIQGNTAFVEDDTLNHSGYYFGYDVHTQTAKALQTLLVIEKDHPMLFPLLLGMISENHKSDYVSSLRLVETLKAMKAYQQAFPSSEEQVTASVFLNDVTVFNKINPDQIENPFNIPMNTLPDKMKLKFVTNSGLALFYNAKLTYALKEFRDYGLEQGVTISREIQTLDNQKVNLNELKHGETYKVILNFFFADHTEYLAITEPLPAGFEPVNFRLKTVNYGLQNKHKHKGVDLSWYLDHKEFHDKKITLFANSVPRGFYEFVYYVNVTNAGDYIIPPAKAFEMYAPEVFGTTGAVGISIK